MAYVHEAFQVWEMEQAKNVVLTYDPNDPEKFKRETDLLVSIIKDHVVVSPDSIVLDYGCGMGRVSKELINTFGCEVIGLDTSESMLFLARKYVGSSKFMPTTRYTKPDSVDVILCSFVLQHVEDPQKEIDNIKRILKPGGTFILLNEKSRLVPSGVDKDRYVIWNDDNFDVHEEVSKQLNMESSHPYTTNWHKVVIYHK